MVDLQIGKTPDMGMFGVERLIGNRIKLKREKIFEPF